MGKKKSLLYGDWSNSAEDLPEWMIEYKIFYSRKWIFLFQLFLIIPTIFMQKPWDGVCLWLNVVLTGVQIYIYNRDW